MNEQILSTIENIKTRKLWIIVQTFIIFILPIVLIKANLVNVENRLYVLGIVITILLIILIREKWTADMLGLTTYKFKKYLLPYILFTALTILICYIFSEKIGKEETSNWWKYSHFLYGFFIVSLLQELGYRGYLIPALGKITRRPIFIIIINALMFMFLHIIFPNPQIGLPIAFIGGIGFAAIYMKYPSLPLIILSHSFINFFVVLYGYFVI